MVIKKLNFDSAVLRLRQAFYAVNTVAALYEESKKEWLRCINPDDDSHYISDYQTDGRKADAVVNYVTRVAAIYMNANGVLPGTLSKDTLSNENAITVAIMRRIAGIQIKNNEEMFLLVGSRLLGIDTSLLKAGVTHDEVRYSHIVTYLVHSLGEEYTAEALSVLGNIIATRAAEGKVDDLYFKTLLEYGETYYQGAPDSIADAIDVLDLVIHQINDEGK